VRTFKLDHRTERLRLRSLDRGAAGQVLHYYRTNADFRAQWSPIPDPAFFTLERQRELLAGEALATANDQQLKAWIFLREDPRR
jgi:hypothetical protein